MDIVVIPGLWLPGHTFDAVTQRLERAGHRVHVVTLPGMGNRSPAERTAITQAEHVDAVAAAIDGADGPVLLVAHGGSSGIGYAAVDARPDRVARAVFLGHLPTPAGLPLVSGLPATDGLVPMPDWTAIGEETNLDGLDEAAQARLYDVAIPMPEQVLTTPLRLDDERRYTVPITLVCMEYTSDDMRGWVAAGAEEAREIPKFGEVTYVDLPGGHWPQLTQPDALARVILDATNSAQAQTDCSG